MATRKTTAQDGTSATSADAIPDDVAALLASLRHPREAEILAVRRIILDADPAIREGVKWNAPSYHTVEHFATFHLRGKAGIQLILHLGAKPRPGVRMPDHIEAPTGLLEWRGPDRAVVAFRDLRDVEAKREAFGAVVRQWVRHV